MLCFLLLGTTAPRRDVRDPHRRRARPSNSGYGLGVGYHNAGWTALSHYGHYLCDNDPDDWDGVDDATRPRLSDDEKRDRRALLVAARDAFLLQKKREENWQRRAPLMHALTGSGLRLTAAQQAEHAAFQAAMDYAAPIAPVPVDRLRDIFSNEGFVRLITEHI